MGTRIKQPQNDETDIMMKLLMGFRGICWHSDMIDWLAEK